MVEYDKRLVEVYEVLKRLSKEDIKKIPKDILYAIKENKDDKYDWKYDELKSLKEQNISKDAIIILSCINMEYLLSDEQKKLMEQIHEENEKKYQIKLNKQTNTTYDIFKSKIEDSKSEKLEIIEINMKKQQYENNIFMKMLKKIRQFFVKVK